MKTFYLLILLLLSCTAFSQVYRHDFGTTPISAHPYTVLPAVLQSNLTGSSWTNSTGIWTSYVGSTGEAIALSNSGGTPTISLTFTVATGYKLNITAFDFWRQRSATGAQNWSMTVNGIATGSGTVPLTGAATGITAVSGPVNNLSSTVTILISLSGASGSGTFRIDDFTLYGNIVPDAYRLLDHFNRNDTIRPAIPSSGGPEWWREIEPGFICSVLASIRIKNNLLELSGCDLSNTTCLFSPTHTTSMDMSLKYPVVFSSAASNMEWYFNMQQSRANPDGFASGQYGVAFVLGSNTNDPNPSLQKYGYAVIFGESGAEDSIRLVSFNGTAFNSTTFTNIISVPSPAVKTNYMSIRVTYNPCNNEWSLIARDDGNAFADPATISGAGSTAVNTTFTSSSLLWLGSVWNHGSSCDLARFDNIYIPNTGTKTGTYIWNGNFGTDYQLPYNWTPVRQCISTTDKLVFNSTSPVLSQVTNVPNQTIAQLTVTNSRTLSLNDVSGDATVSTLTISGAAGTDLQVDAGSTLNLDVTTASTSDAIVIQVGTGATGVISGLLSFNATPGGTRPHRLFAADPLSVSVTGGGVIKALNLTGNAFGTSLPQHTIQFNTGAAYEYYSGANPFGLSQPDSKVLFNSGSVYRHFSNSQPSILGRTYADFENYGTFSITLGGVAAMNVDNLKCMAGAIDFTGVSNSQPVHVNINKDMLISPGATFRYNPAAASVCSFKGAAVAQKINNAGILEFGKQLTVRLNSSFITAPQLTAETDISIAGVLDVVQGTLKLNGNITLLSDAGGTASVAPVIGAFEYGSGRFVVERYIPLHCKAWQFLATPITATGSPTLKQAWQEGALTVNGNPVPGYGTMLTSHVPGAASQPTPGFDAFTPAGATVKVYNGIGYTGLTSTAVPLYNPSGYFVFVRGDRSVTTFNGLPTATILRMKGMLHAPSNPPVSINIPAAGFASIGNPYASAINFRSLTLSGGVQADYYYVWDPKLSYCISGSNSFGGFQTFAWNGVSFDVIPGGGSYTGTNRNIESGQAFFVNTVSGGNTVSFSESAKVTGSNNVYKQIQNSRMQVRVNLHLVNGGERILLDGCMAQFDRAFSGAVDEQDGIKLNNTGGEYLALERTDKLLSVEKRGWIHKTDSLFLNLGRMQIRQYAFEIIPSSIHRHLQNAYLEDLYMNTLSLINLEESCWVYFEINSDPLSFASNRFRIVFTQKKLKSNLPVSSEIFAGKIKQSGFPLNEMMHTDAVKFSVYPNPVAGRRLNMNISFNDPGTYLFNITNTAGKLMYSGSFEADSFISSYTCTLPAGMPAGNYNVELITPNGKRLLQQMIKL